MGGCVGPESGNRLASTWVSWAWFSRNVWKGKWEWREKEVGVGIRKMTKSVLATM